MSHKDHIVLGPNHTFTVHSFRPMPPSTMEALKAKLEEDNEAPATLVRLIHKYLERLREKDGRFHPVTIVEEIRILACEMSMIGLWNKYPLKKFLKKVKKPFPRAARKEFLHGPS